MVQTGNSSPERGSDSPKMAQPGGVRVRIQSYIHHPPSPVFPPPGSRWTYLVPFPAPCEVMRKSVDLVQLPEAGPGVGGGGCWACGLSQAGRALVPAHDWPLGTCPEGHPHVPGKEGGCPRVHRGTCRSHSCIRGTHIGTDTYMASPRGCSMSTQAHGPHTSVHTATPVAPEPQMHSVSTRLRRPVGETRAAGPFTP